MTDFENFLLSIGYMKFIINGKTMKFEQQPRHVISTIENLNHRYFHETEHVILQKIKDGKSLRGNDFTTDELRRQISFGLNEKDKPPTLIFPRPRILIKRIRKGNLLIEDEWLDDSMNVVFKNFSNTEIFEAMFDKNILFEIDLTK